MGNPQLMSVEEFAALLRKDGRTVQNWINAGHTLPLGAVAVRSNPEGKTRATYMIRVPEGT